MTTQPSTLLANARDTLATLVDLEAERTIALTDLSETAADTPERAAATARVLDVVARTETARTRAIQHRLDLYTHLTQKETTR